MKPFDLEAALAGEPVKLRSGWKAYVRHNEMELDVLRPLTGYMINAQNSRPISIAWSGLGYYLTNYRESVNDIISMWPRTITIDDMEVPEPESAPLEMGQGYYIPHPNRKDLYFEWTWGNDSFDSVWLQRGLIHLTREAAITHAEALIRVSGGEV